MTDRINSNRPASAPTAAINNAPRPLDLPGTDQAAAKFAAMLGSEGNGDSNDLSRTESQELSDLPHESDSSPTHHDRVEKKQDRDKGSNGNEGERGDAREEAEIEVFALGDVILQNMSRKDGAMTATAEVGLSSTDVPLDTMVHQVVDRILVSPPGAGGQEVRILLKDSVLPGTEVRISQLAGQMQIQLVTDSTRSHDLLMQHQASLQQRLSEKLGEHDVVVHVEMGAESQPDRDGRSRNQRDIQEELSNSEQDMPRSTFDRPGERERTTHAF